MIQIKNVISTLIVIVFAFQFQVSNAQKINQFDSNKKRTGVWKKYYPNKRIRYVGQFKDGKEVGTFKYYDISTSKHPTIIKEFSANSDSASVKYYTLRGKLRSKGVMVGKNRVGKWIYYFSNGALFSEEFYKNGKLEGVLKNYYKTGIVLEETTYQFGLKNGVSKKYSDTGVLIEQVHFKDGKLDGEAKYFELNGDLKEEGLYKNGKRYGKWEFYIGGKKATLKERNKTNAFNKKDIKNEKNN